MFAFLLLAFLVVGASSIVLFGALGDALNGGFSPIAFVVTTTATMALCVFLPLPTTMSRVALFIVMTAFALLVIPVKRQRLDFRPLGVKARIALTLILCAGALCAHTIDFGKRVLRSVGMTDAWESEPQGYVLQLFSDFCTGLLLAIGFLLIIRVKEELRIRRGHTDHTA